MKCMRGVCNYGNHVTIEKSMIKYMGRSVTYVQYIPAKPIKNVINLFYICCALYAILLGFKVYVGQEDDSNNTALVICDYLVKYYGITSIRGRTICTGNYYTLMALYKHMFNKYGLTMVCYYPINI